MRIVMLPAVVAIDPPKAEVAWRGWAGPKACVVGDDDAAKKTAKATVLTSLMMVKKDDGLWLVREMQSI